MSTRETHDGQPIECCSISRSSQSKYRESRNDTRVMVNAHGPVHVKVEAASITHSYGIHSIRKRVPFHMSYGYGSTEYTSCNFRCGWMMHEWARRHCSNGNIYCKTRVLTGGMVGVSHHSVESSDFRFQRCFRENFLPRRADRLVTNDVTVIGRKCEALLGMLSTHSAYCRKTVFFCSRKSAQIHFSCRAQCFVLRTLRNPFVFLRNFRSWSNVTPSFSTFDIAIG